MSQVIAVFYDTAGKAAGDLKSEASMTSAEVFNEDQRARWNGIDGEYWVREQDRLDRTLQPVLGPLMEFAAPLAGSTVLDIGCGCGATTVELARAAGSAGRVIGLDISEPMLGVARERLAAALQARFLLGDAAELELGGTGAELLVSRFGVMFFGDPVAAFTNLRKGMLPGGRVRFACWRQVSENPWLQVPLHAVYEHVPRLPKPEPGEPGPFAFADTDLVTRILTAAGFTAPTFTPLDVQLDISAGGGVGGVLEAAVEQSAHMGPAKRALKDQPEEIQVAARDSIRRALEPYLSNDGVRLPGAVWLVGAEAIR